MKKLLDIYRSSQKKRFFMLVTFICLRLLDKVKKVSMFLHIGVGTASA